jgi:predicted nucleic acid-binding protein
MQEYLRQELERAGKLQRLEAGSAARDLWDLPIEPLPFSRFADRLWQLRENLTCYDALYVAIAEAFAVPLATLDRKLAKAPGPQCDFLLPA